MSQEGSQSERSRRSRCLKENNNRSDVVGYYLDGSPGL
jgi:hypothetical protein